MKICIYGAGSIGCYLGGRLVAAGVNVDFIVRPRIQHQLQQYGLTVSDYLGQTYAIPASQLQLSSESSLATQADIILVCVKSAATEQVAHELKETLKKNTIVISFQLE